jgi:hypothetical protein
MHHVEVALSRCNATTPEAVPTAAAADPDAASLDATLPTHVGTA